MFEIKTNIGNFGSPKDLLLEMQFQGVEKVDLQARYCLSDILKTTMTIEEVESWINHPTFDK